MKIPIELLLACFDKTAYVKQSVQGGYGLNGDIASNVAATLGLSNDSEPGKYDTIKRLLGAAGLLTGGYLAHRGIKHIFNHKPVGGVKDQLEKALLAHSSIMNEGAMNNLAAQLQDTQAALRNRNLMLGGLGLLAAGPSIATAINSKLNPPPQKLQISLNRDDKGDYSL